MPIGITVTTSETPQPVGAGLSTGNAFFAGLTDRGPLTPTRVQSLAAYITTYGPRTTVSAVLYDTIETFFREGGVTCWVARVSDNTAASAALTLQDAGAHPTVTVAAATPGVDGNNTNIVVSTGSGATFTGNTTSGSPTVSNVSSFAAIGVGTPVTGTGIPANTYVSAVTPGSSTLTLSANASASGTGVTITPGTVTVTVQDASGNVYDTHGPYFTTAQLIADTTSGFVTFAQASGGGNTTNLPVALSATPLAGGLDASDITDTSYITTINTAFPKDLGPGQVSIPGRGSATIITGLAAHCQASNRHGLVDLGATGSAASFVAALGAVGSSGAASYISAYAGAATIPGLTPGTTRTVPASAVVAALCSQVASTGNDNQWPAGRSWPLQFVTGFTACFSAAGTASQVFTQSDLNTLNAAGINVFAIRFGVPCLFGFVTPVLQTTDLIYWSASASRERMALVSEATQLAEPYLFDTLDGQGLSITAFGKDLAGMISRHWSSNALFGQNALQAGSVNVSPPVNTQATEALGQLNAAVDVRISPIAEAVTINIAATAVTQSVVA